VIMQKEADDAPLFLECQCVLVPILEGFPVKHNLPPTTITFPKDISFPTMKNMILTEPQVEEQISYFLPDKSCETVGEKRKQIVKIPSSSWQTQISIWSKYCPLSSVPEDNNSSLYLVFETGYGYNERESLNPKNLSEDSPVIWLDIDGVINAVGHSERVKFGVNATKSDGWRTIVVSGGGFEDPKSPKKKFSFSFRPEVIDRINKWSEVAEVKFLTSWGHFAALYLVPRLGLKNFKHCGFYKGHTKLCEVEELLHDLKRPLIWIDDQLRIRPELSYSIFSIAVETKKVEELAVNLKMIQPCEYLGLLDEDLDAVDAFLALQ